MYLAGLASTGCGGATAPSNAEVSTPVAAVAEDRPEADPPDPSAAPEVPQASRPALPEGLDWCGLPNGPNFAAPVGYSLDAAGPDLVTLRLEANDAKGSFEYAVIWIAIAEREGQSGAEAVAAIVGPRPVDTAVIDGWTCSRDPSMTWDSALAEQLRGAPVPAAGLRSREEKSTFLCGGSSSDGSTLVVSASLARREWHRLGGQQGLVDLGRPARGFRRGEDGIEAHPIDCVDAHGEVR